MALLAIFMYFEPEYASKIAMNIFDILSFDRRSSWNIDGDIAILKFDVLCDLVTSSMTSWIRLNMLSLYTDVAANAFCHYHGVV